MSIKRGVVINLKKKRAFNAILLREYIANGQQIGAFTVEIWKKNAWQEIARSNTIGARKIISFPEVKARKLRVVVRSAKAGPKLSEVEVYRW